MSRRAGDAERLDRERVDAATQPVAGEAPYATLVHAVAAGPSRRDAVQALALALGAEDLLLFLRDPELGVLLPAPGFPRTLPDGRAWRAFLDRCVEAAAAPDDGSRLHRSGAEHAHTGRLRPPGATEPTEATGIASGRDAVLVLLDGTPSRDALAEVTPLLPLLVRAMEGERAAQVADAHARVARDAASRAEAVAASLDTARAALTLALDDARESRSRFQEQAAELQMANEELEAQAQELQAINEELEQQAEELRSTTDELIRQIAAADTATRAREEARAEAEQARRAAEDANRSKSEFLAAMSHELRTPLNAIAGHVQLLEMGIHGPVTGAQHEALGRVQLNQQHLLSLINDVLNFAKLEAGRVEYKTETLRLAEAVADVAPMIEAQLATKGLTFEAGIAPELVVWADRDKLRQVLLNLLSNAIKFTGRGGRVTVDAAAREGADPGVTFLRVSDTGCGIPRDKLDSVFDPFVQVHRNLTRPSEGTGLGLAISRDLARGMSGDLRARSVEGVGSVFTLTLPRAV